MYAYSGHSRITSTPWIHPCVRYPVSCTLKFHECTCSDCLVEKYNKSNKKIKNLNGNWLLRVYNPTPFISYFQFSLASPVLAGRRRLRRSPSLPLLTASSCRRRRVSSKVSCRRRRAHFRCGEGRFSRRDKTQRRRNVLEERRGARQMSWILCFSFLVMLELSLAFAGSYLMFERDRTLGFLDRWFTLALNSCLRLVRACDCFFLLQFRGKAWISRMWTERN